MDIPLVVVESLVCKYELQCLVKCNKLYIGTTIWDNVFEQMWLFGSKNRFEENLLFIAGAIEDGDHEKRGEICDKR